MAKDSKSQLEILSKLGITALNPMQVAALETISSSEEVILLSPTGSGKTVAFLLPIISALDDKIPHIQSLILAPSRELAIQIEQVARKMGSGYKINVVYGGRNFSKDKLELQQPPAILIGTPGRVADHMRRQTIDTDHIKTLVLDEFDKSLEIGFEDDMKDIIYNLQALHKKVLTSATKELEIPAFARLKNPQTLNFLKISIPQIDVKVVRSPSKDKLDILVKTICHLGQQLGIIFCNYRDSIQRVSDHLSEAGILHGCFHGGMEQKDRERVLIKFRNGTHQLIIATDLAARGLDIPEIKYIIHYHLPLRSIEFTHRNGRTARMNKEGKAYLFKWDKDILPDFITDFSIEQLIPSTIPIKSIWITVLVSGGRKDKISKGDIVGLFIKQGGLQKEDIGIIELKSDCAFVALKKATSQKAIDVVNNTKLKKKKVRITLI